PVIEPMPLGARAGRLGQTLGLENPMAGGPLRVVGWDGAAEVGAAPLFDSVPVRATSRAARPLLELVPTRAGRAATYDGPVLRGARATLELEPEPIIIRTPNRLPSRTPYTDPLPGRQPFEIPLREMPEPIGPTVTNPTGPRVV